MLLCFISGTAACHGCRLFSAAGLWKGEGLVTGEPHPSLTVFGVPHPSSLEGAVAAAAGASCNTYHLEACRVFDFKVVQDLENYACQMTNFIVLNKQSQGVLMTASVACYNKDKLEAQVCRILLYGHNYNTWSSLNPMSTFFPVKSCAL